MVLCVMGATAVQAQTPAWQTAVAISSIGATVTATTTDASGNVYRAGNFSGTVSIGAATLSSAGAEDLLCGEMKHGYRQHRLGPTSGQLWR